MRKDIAVWLKNWWHRLPASPLALRQLTEFWEAFYACAPGILISLLLY